LKPAVRRAAQEWQHACPGDNRAFVRELNPKGEVVWSIEKNDLPGIELRGIQTASRLDNGNTIFCNRGSNNPTNRFHRRASHRSHGRQEGRVALRDGNNLRFATAFNCWISRAFPRSRVT